MVQKNIKEHRKKYPKLGEYVNINKPTSELPTSVNDVLPCSLQGNTLAEFMGPMERVRLSPGA